MQKEQYLLISITISFIHYTCMYMKKEIKKPIIKYNFKVNNSRFGSEYTHHSL